MAFYDGGTGNDTLIALTGESNSLFGREGDDLLIGNDGYDLLNGGPGNDILNGGGGGDRLIGGGLAGDTDILRYSLGADTFTGGVGRDIVDYRLAPAGVVAVWNGNIHSGGAAAGDVYSFTFANTLDDLYGSQFSDTLGGTAWDNDIRGGRGDDRIDGNPGNDTLWGERGNDFISGGPNRDTLYGGPGVDRLDGNGAKDILKGGPGSDLLSGGRGDDKLYGGSGDDFLFGGTGKESLDGGDGNDTMYVGRGSTTIDGGAGHVTDADEMSFSLIEELFRIDELTSADWVSFKQTLNFNITISKGYYNFFSSVGSIVFSMELLFKNIDNLRGYMGNDTFLGNGHDNRLRGLLGNDSLVGRLGNDTLWGDEGRDTLLGGGNDDLLQGGPDNDTLKGGDGNDRLSGGPGRDLLIGGYGNDEMTGGGGRDTFVYEKYSAVDLINDFENDKDVLDLSDFDFDSVDDALAYVSVYTADVVYFYFGAGETLEVRGLDLDLLADDILI